MSTGAMQLEILHNQIGHGNGKSVDIFVCGELLGTATGVE